MKYLPIIFVGCMSQFAGIGVITTAISKLELIDHSGTFSSIVSITNILGISFTGVLLGGVLSKYQGFKVGFYSPIIALIGIIPLALVNNIYIVIVFIFLISIIMGFENPNNNSSLNKLIKEHRKKAHIFTKYTTMIQFSVVLSPIFSAIIIIYCGHNVSFLFFMLFYFSTCLPWILSKDLRNLVFYDTNKNTFSTNGYRIILLNKPLRGLTISRILNNLLFNGIIILIPVMIVKSTHSNSHFTFIQNLVISIISVGFILNGLISNSILKRNPLSASIFSKMSTIFALLAIVIASILQFNEYSLCIMALLLGWGQFYFRVSGMTLGQIATPSDHLAEVILAGDTLVRGITAIYSIILLLLVNYFESFYPLFIFCIIGATAPFFLKNILNVYKTKIKESV